MCSVHRVAGVLEANPPGKPKAHTRPRWPRGVCVFQVVVVTKKVKEVLPYLQSIDEAELARRHEAIYKLIPRLVYGRLGFDSGGFGVAFQKMRDRLAAQPCNL